jgi:TPR repeat protein
MQADPPDHEGALELFMRSALAGNPVAAFNLAQMHRLGLGVRADRAESARWYERAAAAGFAPAQVNLAVMLLAGDGIEADRGRARDLLGRAAAAGNPQAIAVLARIGAASSR